MFAVVVRVTRVEPRDMAPFARLRIGALLALVFCFTATHVAVAIAPAASQRRAIRIGLLAPASGNVQNEGGDIVAGFQYYLASHGDRLGGFDVTLRTGDEGASVDSAVAVARELVEREHVDAIVGIVNSADAYGIAAYLDGRDIPLVIAGAGADELTQRKASPWVFRVSHTSSQDVMPLGDYVCRRTGHKRIALVAEDAPYGWEALGGFARAYIDAGCRVVQESYAPAGGDWSIPVAKIDRSADGVFAVVGNADAAAFVTAFKAAMPKTPLYGDSTLTSPRVLRAVRAKGAGIVTGSHYASTLRTRENAIFGPGYERLTNRLLTYFVENGYVAAQALSAALARLAPGSLHEDDIAQALRSVAFRAPRGFVRFDAFRQIVNDVFVRRVRYVRGRYQNVVIETYPKVSQFWRYDPQKYLQLPAYAKLKGTWVKT
jgi:branched-chain amino acid transport system substrate-binding protein